MRPTDITLAIFEKYTPEELAATAAQMAAAQSEMESAEAEKKVSDGVFNERIKKHAAEVSELAQKYNKGGETAQIGCTIRYDIPAVGKKSYIRMDTEAVVEVHDMSLEEKQETLQFPLTSSEAKPEKKTGAPKVPKVEPAAVPESPALVTFRDFQSIAKHIAKLEADKRPVAIREMAESIALKLHDQKSAISPDGRLEPIDSKELALKLAQAWLELAVERELTPPSQDEVTRICPYPGCILFSEHDGPHEFPPTDPPAKIDTRAEPQMQREEQPKRRTRKTKLMGQDAILPDQRKPEDPKPGAQA